MKRIISLSAIAAIVIGASSFVALKDSYKVNVDQSKVEWIGGSEGHSHPGYFKLSSGKLDVKKNKLVGGTFVIDLTSVTVTDGAGNKLSDHLKNKDFFNTEVNKEATFTITKVDYTTDNAATITGDLDLLGSKLAVSFPVTTSVEGEKFTGSGKLTFDRSLWGINYGVEGGKIPKEVAVSVNIVAED